MANIDPVSISVLGVYGGSYVSQGVHVSVDKAIHFAAIDISFVIDSNFNKFL